jgi:predicted amidohydrolase
LASELNIWLLIGSALVLRADGQAANRSLMISPDGQIVAAYDKIHMFDVDLPTGERHRESSAYTPGEAAVIANLPWQKLGLSICYDMRFSYLYRALAQAGAGMISVPAAFTRPTGAAHWEILLRARAIENLCYVVGVNRVGKDGNGESDLSTWKSLLDEQGWKGYLNFDVTGLGDMTVLGNYDENPSAANDARIQTCYDAGWDVINHSLRDRLCIINRYDYLDNG